MPSLKTHQLVGITAGAVSAAYSARQQTDENFWIETIGGGLGGYIGGSLPDVLEPAVSSWHRGFFHSVTAGGGVVAGNIQWSKLIEACRERARNARATQTKQDSVTGEFMPVTATGFDQFIAAITELFWRLLAGFLNGLAPGYVSHLLLDATTPRGIPLLR